MRVPKPTRSPASATQPRPKPWRMGAGPAKACQAKPATISPAMNQARQSRSPANRPCRMPLTPAMRPLSMSSHTLARPIKAPPITAGRGVKFSIAMVFRQLFDPQSSTYTYLLADAASREAGRRAGRGAGSQAGVDAGDASACRPRHRRLAAEAEARQPYRGVARERRAGRRPLSRARGGDPLWRNLPRSAPDPRPHRRLRELRARRPLDGVHRRCAPHPRLRPHRLPGWRPVHAVPLGARADLLAAGALPDLSRA